MAVLPVPSPSLCRASVPTPTDCPGHGATPTQVCRVPPESLCVCGSLSRVRLFATPRTVALQAPLSVGFSRQPTGVGCHAFLQGIVPTQRWNLGLPHCRQSLYHLSHQGSPILSQGASRFRAQVLTCCQNPALSDPRFLLAPGDPFPSLSSGACPAPLCWTHPRRWVIGSLLYSAGVSSPKLTPVLSNAPCFLDFPALIVHLPTGTSLSETTFQAGST